MSNEYDNVNRGAVWKNENKKSENHPDFSGSINIEGREFWLSGWRKKSDASDRAPLVSFSVRPKDDNPSQSYQQSAPQKAQDDFEDDIPFN